MSLPKHDLVNPDWKSDDKLATHLQDLVKKLFKRKEILDFVKRDFPQYTWSLRTLCRRLQHFNITYTNRTISLNEVKLTVHKELQGPGKFLGYRAMQQKLRIQHNMNVPRDLVYAAMSELDPEGLQSRIPGKKRPKKGYFTSKGSDWVHSLDGHCKLMGFQRSTFPLAVYGCIDTASRKLLWLRIWKDNCDPKLIGRWYFDYLYEKKIIAKFIRLDKGTETGIMATMHAFLRGQYSEIATNAGNTVIYGKSTSNQIERWWKELHERLEKYFKGQLMFLKDNGHYNPESALDRDALAFVYIPVLEREMKDFVNNWNTHRIRYQKSTYLPDGIPDHIYNFPEKYGLRKCGQTLTDVQLKEVADVSEVLKVPNDFLLPAQRSMFENCVADPYQLSANKCVETYLLLKQAVVSKLNNVPHFIF